MTRASAAAVENNFVKGKITEFTGLNYPDNAAIEDDNCIFTRTGLVYRRPGIDFETNYTTSALNRDSAVVSTYYWKNVAGDGSVDVYVTQIGTTLHFWDVSTPDKADSVSSNKFSSTVNLTTFLPVNSPNVGLIAKTECQYVFGFGFLFVFHPYLDPIYISFASNIFTATGISIKTRDIPGITENVANDFRPVTLIDTHTYNLLNQGWRVAPPWTATSATTNTVTLGNKTFTVEAGLTATSGDNVVLLAQERAYDVVPIMSGTVFSYVGTTLVITVTQLTGAVGTGAVITQWSISANSSGYIDTFQTGTGTYPSNADQWWRFKDSTGVFSPSTTAGQVSLGSGPAPKGYFILDEFNKQRSVAAGVSVTDTLTYARPSTGCWAQGRVWYTGVNTSGLNNKIYFSQIIENPNQLGYCYQRNDPTSEILSDLLPSDGGVISVFDAETIHKIMPYKNTILVFASNGIWSIAGSQGIGFTAIDYTIHKLEDAVPTLSHTSFVDVQGTPMWWNNEGIYTINVKQQNFSVDSLTHVSIATFFDNIPAISKKFARGYYNKVDYIVQWLYRGVAATSRTETYEFTHVLNLNTITGAFYSWTIEGFPKVNALVVLDSSGDLTTNNTVIEPVYKYLTSYPSGETYSFTFSEVSNLDYLDWESYDSIGTDYTSYFITGYKVFGDAQRKFQTNYVYVFSEGTQNTAYTFQGIWNYANSNTTGQFSSLSRSAITDAGYNYIKRRYKIRGHGLACQFKFSSVSGSPFQLIGWSTWQTQNSGI